MYMCIMARDWNVDIAMLGFAHCLALSFHIHLDFRSKTLLYMSVGSHFHPFSCQLVNGAFSVAQLVLKANEYFWAQSISMRLRDHSKDDLKNNHQKTVQCQQRSIRTVMAKCTQEYMLTQQNN